MDYRAFEFQSELTDFVIRVSSLDPPTFHQALLIHKALLSLNAAVDLLDKYIIESES